jgi:hypothetical protein
MWRGGAPVRTGITRDFTEVGDRWLLLTIRLHELRHFAAAGLLAARVPVRTVSGRLGHDQRSDATLSRLLPWPQLGLRSARRYRSSRRPGVARFSYHQTMSTSHFRGLRGLYQGRSRSSEG